MTIDTVDYRYYRDSLESLGCPYISTLDNESLRELLFRPGEARIRFFEWLLSQLSAGVEHELTGAVLGARVKDSKVQKLLKISSNLGLCSRNDYELVQGNCSLKRQCRFYRRVLEMLSVKCTLSHDTHKTEEENTRYLCCSSSLNTYNLVNELTLSPSYKDMFSKQLNLFPPSLACFSTSSKKSVPSLNKLQERADKFLEEVTELNMKLETLQHIKHEELDTQRMTRHRKTLYHTFSTLTQTINSFFECYQSEFKPWSGRVEVELNNIGPLSKKVNEQLLKVLHYLDNLKCYNECIEFVENVDVNQKLTEPLSQTESSELVKRLEILQLHFEFKEH